MRPWMIICGLAVVVFFKAAGWIPNWSMGLGIIAIVLAVLVLQSVAPAQLGAFSKIFLWVFTLGVVLPSLYNAVLNDAPLTGGAIEMQKEETDVSTAQRIRPSMLFGEKGILLAANKLDDEIGKTLARKAQNLVSQYSQATGSNAEAIQKELLVLAEQINQHQKYQEQLRKKALGEDTSFFGFIGDVWSSSWRLIMWVVAIIVIGVLLWVLFSTPAASRTALILPTTWKIIGIFVGVFLVDKIVFAGSIGLDTFDLSALNSLPNNTIFFTALGALVFLILWLITKKAGWIWAGILVCIGIIVTMILLDKSPIQVSDSTPAPRAGNNTVTKKPMKDHRKEPKKATVTTSVAPVSRNKRLVESYSLNLDPVRWSGEITVNSDQNINVDNGPGWLEWGFQNLHIRIKVKEDGSAIYINDATGQQILIAGLPNPLPGRTFRLRGSYPAEVKIYQYE